MAIVNPTGRPKSVRNGCEIEVFWGLFVLSCCVLDLAVGVGAFVIRLSQISSFLLINVLSIFYTILEKREEIWLSPMTKAPTPTEMSKGESDITNNATKSSIKQRLRTDLGRSVGVTTATQLVWLTGLRAHLPTNHNSRLIKRTHV